MSDSTKDAEASEPSSSGDDSGTDSAKKVGRKRTIDGNQLEPDDARKLEARRAYNRQCAAKGKTSPRHCPTVDMHARLFC